MMRIHLPVMLVFFLLISSTASLAVFEFITAETDTYAHVYSGGGKENNFASDGFLKMEWQYTSPDDGFLIPRVFLEKSRPYLKFDLSSIPDDATIVYADVVMAQWMGSTQDNIGLYKVSDNNLDGVPWTDTNLNWKNAPVNWDRGLTTSVGSGQQWVTFPLYASEVQASLRSNKISFAMKFENETANKYHVFCGEGFSNRWGCTTTAGFDKTEPELRVTYTLPCDRYTGIVDGWYECMSDTRCTWCGGCQLGTVARASCMNKEQCTRTCVLGQCGAECSGTNRTYDRCDGDLLNYSWTCSSNCTWQYRTTNCNNLDGWYGTDNTTWTAEDKCTENEQRVEEYRDYTCGTIIPCANCRGSPGCTYSVTDRRTAPTGNTREAQSRDCQPATAEENDCNSLRRCASEYNNNMENASDSIKSLVGNERINLVMGEGKDRVVCGAVANDARIGTLKAGGIDKPTINVFAEKTVLQSICKSPKPEEAFKAAMKSGEIKLRGAGAGNRAKMAVGRTVARILSRFTGSMFDVKKNEQKLIEYEGKKGVLMLNSMGQRIIQFLNSNVVIVIDKYGNKISQSSLAEQDLIGHGNMPALIDYPSRPTGLEIDGVVQTFSNVIQALTQTGMQTISGGISQMASSAQNNTQQMKSGCSLTGSISSCAQMQKQSAQDMQTIENTLKIQQQMMAMVNTIIQQQQQTISPISSTR